MFAAIIRKWKPRRLRCEPCQSGVHGECNALDCGCAWEEIVGEYPTANVARLVAMSKAKKKGTHGGGISTGFWAVEDEKEETVDCGHVEKNPLAKEKLQ